MGNPQTKCRFQRENHRTKLLNGGFVQRAMFDYGKVAISFGSKHLIFINAAGQHVEER